MNPGRDLDALIAEKVMGWIQLFGYQGISTDGFWNIIPKYSTDIAAAWEVVVHLRDLEPFDFTLFWNGHTAYAEFDERKTDTRASAYTAPHAICLAALKLVGALEK